MKRLSGSRITQFLVRLGTFLITAALIAGMAGCGPVTQYSLTISSTEGGQVTEPGEGTFAYNQGTAVNLIAEAEEGYSFVEWTGDVSTIADVEAATTTIYMEYDYSITANFAIAAEIRDWHDLDAVRDNLAGNYRLMNDLDSSTTGYEELAGPDGNEGMGWLPIGTEDDAFTGNLDGQGYEIRDLFVTMSSGLPHVGVFGFVDEGGRIEDIGVVDAVVDGSFVAGGLAGVCYGTVTNSYSIASVYGDEGAGGLVGICNGTVANSYSAGNVSGESGVGGLVGWNGNEGTVSNSYSTGNVTGNHAVGGLVGFNEGTVTNSYAMGTLTSSAVVAGGLVGVNAGTVTKSHSAGSVTGDMEVGGLVGLNGWYMDGYSNPGTVTKSYSTGNVTGGYDVGGLVGGNGYDSIVSDSYATGNVSGDDCAGGLVGTNVGAVEDSYSTGKVTGSSNVGGLVGDDGSTGTASNSFWDTETSGQATSDAGTGRTTAQMKDIATFSGAGWSIVAVALNETNPSYIWNIIDDVTYPFLSWQP